VGVALLVGVLSSSLSGSRPRFYPDDPLWIDDDTSLDASKAAPLEETNSYDFLSNTFAELGDRRDVRALNVNTLDELPDSSWFTNRIGRRDMSVAEVVRGPDRSAAISLDGWVVAGGKGTGVQPGFRMTDPQGQLYQVEVDPMSNPEMATGAEIIGTAFYHAFGYHVVDVYLAELDADRIVIADTATIRDPLNGRRRRLVRWDIDQVFKRAARRPDGKYRVLVSRFAEGRGLGNFRYYGTRPDDPNDVVPHEHRRELRAARVFGAWLNHDDSRGVNSLAMLVEDGNRKYIKHYMFDFGSLLGSGTFHPQAHRAGNEYIFEWKPGWATLATLGAYLRPWMLIQYPDVPPSVGRFEGEAFDAEAWKPEYPNPAFANMRADDAFWAARIVARFDEPVVRAIVEKAKYSDPRATDYITETLMKRRDKVLRAWLNQVNPVVDVTLDAAGALAFRNAAVEAGTATPPQTYGLQWFRFDNATDTKTNVGGPVSVTEPRARAPEGLLDGTDFVGVTMIGTHPQQPGWARPATFYFRRTAGGWDPVGIER
jgi:hypothetical protein